jgi:hypothetical protein
MFAIVIRFAEQHTDCLAASIRVTVKEEFTPATTLLCVPETRQLAGSGKFNKVGNEVGVLEGPVVFGDSVGVAVGFEVGSSVLGEYVMGAALVGKLVGKIVIGASVGSLVGGVGGVGGVGEGELETT